MDRRRSFVGGMISGIVLTLFIGCGFFAGKQLYSAFGQSSAMNETEQTSVVNADTTQKMSVLEDMIAEYYLESVSAEDLENGIYKGMLDSLDDPYSVYYTPEELESIEEKTEGIFYGIGVKVTLNEEYELPEIVSVMEDTPAEEIGLQAGDLIYKANDEELQGMDLNSAVALIKGAEGTSVHLTVIREGESDYLEFDATRRKVKNETVVQKMLDDNIGYIQITEFDDVTVEQFTDALAVCKGSGMKGLILDLRSNPGGNVNSVCDIARMLLPEGLIVYTEDKDGNRKEYTCDGEHQIEVPMVVLVDGNSASASEILAGAIKDYGIGTLVGTTTFGKGIVQSVMKLSDGSAVKLTVSKYYTPSGKNIHKIGIEPDVEVPFDADAYAEGTDNQLEAAIEELKGKLE